MDESGRSIEPFISPRHAEIIREVTHALTGAATLADAAPATLAAVCQSLGWEYGALWEVDASGSALTFVGSWPDPPDRLAGFVDLSRSMTFARGIGLPGRVWASARPAWIPDVVVDDNFPRTIAARLAGLHSAFAAPVVRGTDVVGVMEFFSREIREPGTALLDTLTTAASQVGLYAAEKSAADQLDAFFNLSPDLLCVASL